MNKKAIVELSLSIVLAGAIMAFIGYTTFIVYRNNGIQKDIVKFLNSQIEGMKQAQQQSAQTSPAPAPTK